jgi:hypothetical protein
VIGREDLHAGPILSWDVPCRQDGDHARHRARGAGVDGEDVGGGVLTPDDPSRERTFDAHVARIAGGAGDLGSQVYPRVRDRRRRLAGGGGDHGLDHLLISAATADVARERNANFIRRERPALGQDRGC